MNIVILDLEWNPAYSRRLQGYINEIIEFGAVKCGSGGGETDSFSLFVKPQVTRRLNAVVSDLTNLTEDSLSDGVPFLRAVRLFRQWAGDSLILTWGTSDILTLIENCRYFTGSGEVPFLSRYCDLQAYVQDCLGLGTKEQLGLARAAELLKIDLSQMDQHRALDDSRITRKIFSKVYDPERLAPFVQECGSEFYRRITFKTAYITDLNSPLLTEEVMGFSCPECGGETERKSRWLLRNRGFRAEFRCPACGTPFEGRLMAKLKYEGLSVSRKTVPLGKVEKPRPLVPGPMGNMVLEDAGGVGVLRFPNLSGIAVNAFTTRIGGVSKAEFASMNLGFGRGDEEENVAENVRRFCAAAGFDSQSLVTGDQDHHVNIRWVGAGERGVGFWKPRDRKSVDGLCTDEPGVTLVIYCADCVPLYFVDEEHRAVGLAHAGWRGTAAGMARVMVERMREEFGTDPAVLKAAIGPSICKDCFEVDPPCAEEFLKLPGAERFVSGPEEEKYHVDLWECNRSLLLAAGLREENITVGKVCTMCESDLLFSHRKTRGHRGSNCALLALKE